MPLVFFELSAGLGNLCAQLGNKKRTCARPNIEVNSPSATATGKSTLKKLAAMTARIRTGNRRGNTPQAKPVKNIPTMHQKMIPACCQIGKKQCAALTRHDSDSQLNRRSNGCSVANCFSPISDDFTSVRSNAIPHKTSMIPKIQNPTPIRFASAPA